MGIACTVILKLLRFKVPRFTVQGFLTIEPLNINYLKKYEKRKVANRTVNPAT